MVRKRNNGATLGEIAREYGLTRERVRQICTAADPGHTEKANRARADRKEQERRDRHEQYLREVQQSDRQCPVCLSKMHPSVATRVKTCGGECAEVWAKARYHLDDSEWHRHRESVAKSIINHSHSRRDSEVAWAKRVVSGDAPEPRGRWYVAGSEVERLMNEVVPRLRGMA